MTNLERALLRIDLDLRQIGAEFALVGGLAVSLRAEPRTTRDVDLAVAVETDLRSEKIVHALLARGYRVGAHIEQDRVGQLASVRLELPDEQNGGVVVDLLFASSGIEREIVEAAEVLEILPGTRMRVARCPHLVAMKVLAGRPQDLVDIESLRACLDGADYEVVQQLLELISRRGFDRQKDLASEFERLVVRSEPGGETS